MKNLFYLTIVSIYLVGCTTNKKTVSNKETTINTNSYLPSKEDRKLRELFFDALKEKALGNNEKAIGLFNKCLDIDAGNAAAYNEISILYDREDNYILALHQSEKAVKNNTTNKWYLLQLALMQKKSLKYEEALISYEKLTELDPENLDFLISLSEAYMYNSKPEKAANIFDKIQNITGKNEEITIQKHKLYLQAGKVDKAIAEIQKLVDSKPNEPRYLNLLGQLYEKNEEQKKAIEIYKKIVDLNPTDGMASLSLALYYKNIKNLAETDKYMKIVFQDTKISASLKFNILINYVEESIKNEKIKIQTISLIRIMQEKHPNNVKSFVIAGDFFVLHKQYDEARNSFLSAFDLDKNSFPILSQLIAIDLQTKSNQHLLYDTKQGLELFPTQPIFYLYNGIALRQAKKYIKSSEILETGKELIIEDADLLVDFYQNIGEAYHQANEYKKADEAFEKALSINPDLPFLLNNYSYYLSVRKENLKRAAEMARKANELYANQASFEDTYGWILFQQGNYKEAKEWLEKALNNGGNESAVILEHYGDILYKLENKEKAVSYWKKAKDKKRYSDLLDKKIEDEKYYE
jgi:tetratricopeptide (TPR) repeat protein